MPQALLPLIPDGATPINGRISVTQENHQWTYFCGVAPVFQHAQDDRRSFRMFTAQLVCQGACRQIDVIRVFGVSANSVRRGVEKYRQEGAAGFYGTRKGRGATVMTNEVTAQAQQPLSLGGSRREVADQLGVRYDTLRKNGPDYFPNSGSKQTPNGPARCMSTAMCGSITASKPSCLGVMCRVNGFVYAARRTIG